MSASCWQGRLAFGLICALAPMPALAGSRCDDLLPRSGRQDRRQTLGVTTSDIVRLRDIGPPDNAFGDISPLAVSPDGRTLAFPIQRADPDSDTYCQGLVVLPLDGAPRPRLIDRGGEPVRFVFDDLRGMRFPTGSQAVVQPIWSPNGRRIAYLKRVEDATQAWIASLHGRKARQASREATDVDDVRWSRDGRHLWIMTKPALVGMRTAIAAERRSGIHYDARIMPLVGLLPFPGPSPSQLYCIDLDGGRVPSERCGSPVGAARPAASSADAIRSVQLSAADASDFTSPTQLHIGTVDGRDHVCGSPVCQGVLTGAWVVDGAVVYSRREGMAESISSLYRVTRADGEPARLFSTTGVLVGCVPRRATLICAEEDATAPRRLVAIDTTDGTRHVLFDPNPEFADLARGAVRRLFWTSNGSVRDYGDLVLPPSHEPGQRHPLVIVQYTSRGFLRGGTGDEYPIFALAQAGFAVLSFQRPRPYAETLVGRKFSDWIAAEPENVRDWAERKHLLAALLGGIRAAENTGTIDASKIGITGMSDGASTVQFALINAPIFAAASLSSCCEDPRSLLSLGGPAFAAEREQAGWPGPATMDVAFWRPYSLALNAAAINTPILMQLPSDEYEEGLESYDALKAAGKPVDMYIFDDEHHVKDQPSHRQAIYDRNLRWFEFWLLDRRTCVGNDAECRRWLGLAALQSLRTR